VLSIVFVVYEDFVIVDCEGASPPAERPPVAVAPVSVDDDDTMIWKRVAEGDDQALECMMDKFQPIIYNVTLRLTQSASDAEELTQDVFVRATRSLRRRMFRGDSSLKTWLFRIALNLARNKYHYHRRRHRDAHTSLDMPIGESEKSLVHDVIPDESCDVRANVVHEEFAQIAAQAMLKLDPRHREILHLRTVLHRSYEEISDLLNLNVGTVKSRIARARETLLREMQIICPDLEGDDKLAWLKS
jgi:RNA polymerase sigma-70 factor (ECF subfamily)